MSSAPTAPRSGGMIGRALPALSRPMPADVAHYREPARTALVAAALMVALVTMWFPHPGEIEFVGVVILGAAVALTGVASSLKPLHAFFNRFGGLLAVAQTSALVWLTGGQHSVYRPLFIMLLLFAAIFYDGGRVLATGAVVMGALLLPWLYGTPDPAYMTEVLVTALVWILITATVHWLVSRLRASAQRDGLTGLWNHVTFWRLLHLEHERVLRFGGIYSVLLLDLDHFKRINDRWGHRAGDEVLRQVAAMLARRVRATDVVARYGGEEFAVVLPETDRDTAVELARELRLRVLAGPLPHPVTVSIGVACSGDPFGISAEAVLSAADAALYGAKQAGRNHVAVALPGPGMPGRSGALALRAE
jgi:diguanylate cyclase (GGDEF)-like protein